jgi:hypothetical protein
MAKFPLAKGDYPELKDFIILNADNSKSASVRRMITSEMESGRVAVEHIDPEDFKVSDLDTQANVLYRFLIGMFQGGFVCEVIGRELAIIVPAHAVRQIRKRRGG